MRVTFECEKCGTVLAEFQRPDHDRIADEFSFLKSSFGPCPKCAEPFYGPLTVENVAKALRTVREDCLVGNSITEAQALMVIKMINEIDEMSHRLEYGKDIAPLYVTDPVKWMTSL